MPRPPRIDYENAWHHAMNRGADRQPTFLDDTDRRSFLFLLSEIDQRFGVEVHAYCLMRNHYHLLLRSRAANLSRAMQRIDALYTQRFNRRHERDGSLFRGRFRSRLIETEMYLAGVSAYIHRNPLEAGIVEVPVRYRWSSLPAYQGKISTPGWLQTQAVLDLVGGRSAYASIVERATSSGAGEDWLECDPDHEGAVETTFSPCPGGGRPSIGQVEMAVASFFGVAVSAIHSTRRGQRNVARMAAIAIGHRAAGLTMAELAHRYGMSSASSASSSVARLARLTIEDPRLAHELDAITDRLFPNAKG